MSIHILDRAYLVEEPAGIPAHRVVVHGTASGQCELPTGANEGGLLGVTVETQDREGASVGVRKLGVVLVEAAGAIARGAAVNVAGSSGRVKAVDESAGTVHVLGYAETEATQAGDLVEVFLAIHDAFMGL